MPLQEDGFWLYVLSTEDYHVQTRQLGTQRFAQVLGERLRDAAAAGRMPVLVAPQSCVDAALQAFGNDAPVYAIPFCGHQHFEDLMLGAEHAFFWNQASNSILLRLQNALPVWFFDQGHLLRMAPGVHALAMKTFFGGLEVQELDCASGLDAADLRRRSEATRDARSALSTRYLALNKPTDLIRLALARRRLALARRQPSLAGSESPAERPRLRVRFGGLELLEFAFADARDLFEIRDHPSVREFMPAPSPLVFESHLRWLNANVTRGGALRLFIVRMAGSPIGFTVCKQLASGDLELGVIFKEADHHAGLPAQTAAIMLHLALEHLDAAAVVTYVNVHHERALAFNRGFGLLETPSSKAGELCFRTPRATVLANERYRKIMERIARTLLVDSFAWS
jgi:RimJ/RimL family protein N-acetyltransferase